MAMPRRPIGLSLKKLPESGAGAVPADKHPGFKKRLGEVLGIGKCELLGH